MSDLNEYGVSPETEIQILRKRKSCTIKISDLRDGDYLHPGSGEMYWKCAGVNTFQSNMKAFEISCSSGASLRCIEGTILAGAAGNMLLSSRRGRPTVSLLRQYIPTGEARRRFTVRLLNPERADKIVVSAFSSGKKVFYDLYSAEQFMLNLKASRPELDYVSGVEFSSRTAAHECDFLPVTHERSFLDRPVLPLFGVTDTPGPIVLARAGSGIFAAQISRVDSVREISPGGHEWCWPIFRDCKGGNQSFEANGLMVFDDDAFVSRKAYKDTADLGEPPYFRTGKITPTVRRLSLEECFALKGESAVVEALNVKEAADAFLLLSARMQASGLSSQDLCSELNRRSTK